MLRVPSQYVTSFRSVHSLSWVLVVSHFHKVSLDYQTGSLYPGWPGQMKTSTLCKPRTTSAQIQLQASACSSSKGFLKTTPLWQQYTSIKLSLFKWNVSALFLWRHLIKAHSMLTHSQAAFRSSKPVELTIAGWLWIFLPRFFFSNLRRFLLSARPVCRVSLVLCTTMQLPTMVMMIRNIMMTISIFQSSSGNRENL